ncbi:Uncharacterized protein APZ42_023068 [Daphnia magna]|uniref:Uncharacterized protein n=1 Tax=Daphnia magna TaxID=35525 RepID=A0A0P6AXP0_9CRUS|nr:Uncharacterized protein APZ42_023068 [Daphnia magna]
MRDSVYIYLVGEQKKVSDTLHACNWGKQWDESGLAINENKQTNENSICEHVLHQMSELYFNKGKILNIFSPFVE